MNSPRKTSSKGCIVEATYAPRKSYRDGTYEEDTYGDGTFGDDTFGDGTYAPDDTFGDASSWKLLPLPADFPGCFSPEKIGGF